jgi:hypothetical protein
VVVVTGPRTGAGVGVCAGCGVALTVDWRGRVYPHRPPLASARDAECPGADKAARKILSTVDGRYRGIEE